MADIIPQYFVTQQANKKIDFENDSIKCIMCSGTYDESTLRDIRYYGNVSANEIPQGNGYTSGGVEVSGTSAFVDDTNNRTVYFCNYITFTASGGTVGPVRYGVMYDITGEYTTVYVFDFGENRTIEDGSNLVIRTDPDGFLRARQSTA